MPRTRRTILTTFLFTDIAGSTKVAEEMGDRRWRELLAQHHRIIGEGLREFGGRKLDTAGDGVFARFRLAGVGDPLCTFHWRRCTGATNDGRRRFVSRRDMRVKPPE